MGVLNNSNGEQAKADGKRMLQQHSGRPWLAAVSTPQQLLRLPSTNQSVHKGGFYRKA